jgi:hypothetical protein
MITTNIELKMHSPSTELSAMVLSNDNLLKTMFYVRDIIDLMIENSEMKLIIISCPLYVTNNLKKVLARYPDLHHRIFTPLIQA